MRVAIYGLYSPSGELRYIGKANNPDARFKGHFRDARRRRTPLYDWIRSLVASGQMPSMNVLRWCEDHEWADAEREEIAKARATSRLLNLAEGGSQPYCARETRAENGRKNAASRDKVLWQLKLNMGQSLRCGYVSEATKAKMRARPDVFGQFAEYL